MADTGDGLESKDLQTMISDRNETAQMMVKRVWPRVEAGCATFRHRAHIGCANAAADRAAERVGSDGESKRMPSDTVDILPNVQRMPQTVSDSSGLGHMVRYAPRT